jgi:hypothetical protein
MRGFDSAQPDTFRQYYCAVRLSGVEASLYFVPVK